MTAKTTRKKPHERGLGQKAIVPIDSIVPAFLEDDRLIDPEWDAIDWLVLGMRAASSFDGESGLWDGT
ncbi:hypothetical protein [Altererythrobacter sp. GH1-8]|uniref:hypothetical protein n=1 Tax=Altererythrobacter sp. GH1-8 TaxID=3349333 RepID=UPI00374DC7A1